VTVRSSASLQLIVPSSIPASVVTLLQTRRVPCGTQPAWHKITGLSFEQKKWAGRSAHFALFSEKRIIARATAAGNT
jgi:hypothetical protein